MMKAVLMGHVALGVVVLGTALISPAALAADMRQAELGADSLQKRTVTVYGNGFAHVQEDHKAVLQKGPTEVVLENVPLDVDAGSVALDAEGLALKDLTLSLPPRSASDYLQRAVGQEVMAVRVNPRNGRDLKEEAILISASPSPVLLIDDAVELAYPGRIVLSEDALDFDPSAARIVAETTVVKTAKRDVRVQYKVPGLQWQANYLATFDAKAEQIRLQGRIGISNNSRTDFEDVALRVVSGQVHQQQEPRRRLRTMTKSAMMADAEMAATPENIAPVQASGYHLYPLPGAVDLNAGAHKEIVFFEGVKIPVSTVYVVSNPVYASTSTRSKWQRRGATLRLDVAKENVAKDAKGKDTKATSSDRPALPSGVMRVVAPQADGVDMLIGESRIPHTPAGDAMKISLGRSVDVAAKARQLRYEKVGRNTKEHAFEVVLSNASDQPVQMEVSQAFSGRWHILRESLEHRMTSSHTALWATEVPAKSEKTFTFTVRISW